MIDLLATEKELTEVQRALKKAEKINCDLKKKISSLSRKNVVRRLEWHENDIQEMVENEGTEKQKLNKEIHKLEQKVKDLQKKNRNIKDSRRYF